MKRVIIIFSVGVLFGFGIWINGFTVKSSQHSAGIQNQKQPEQEQILGSLWKEVEALEKKGLTKSALKKVETINILAKKKKEPGHIVKSILFKIRYMQNLEENASKEIHSYILDELKESDFPVKPVLYSILAEQYGVYYDYNRNHLGARILPLEKMKDDDMETWDSDKFESMIAYYFDKSLEPLNQLKETPVEIFDEILDDKSKGKSLRPTLYDFLAHRAIDSFSNQISTWDDLNEFGDNFILDSEDYFDETGKFIAIQLKALEKNSHRKSILKYLQGLEEFHYGDKNPTALIDVTLKRLDFVEKYAALGNKETLYESALQKLIEKYKKFPCIVSVYYRLAEALFDKTDRRNSQRLEEKNRLREKAYKLLSTAISLYPNALGIDKCRKLIKTIESTYLEISIEETVIPAKPFLGSLRYRNLDHVFLRLVKISREEKEGLKKKDFQVLINSLLTKPVVKTRKITLPGKRDFVDHITEIKLDSLPIGNYAILVSASSSFDNEKHLVTCNLFTVSRIGFFCRKQQENELDVFLVNRETGQPLPNVKLQVLHYAMNKKTYHFEYRNGEIFLGNTNGYVHIPRGIIRNDYFNLLAIDRDESVVLEPNNIDPPLPPSFFNKSPSLVQTLFFLDRAIYRPGQTVCFKGIIIEADPKNENKNKILPNHPASVKIIDTNKQTIFEKKFITNEYGTFNSSFLIPSGIQTGEMSITCDTGSAYFIVEEYKRSGFKIGFKPFEDTPRLNKQIEIKGEAISNAGFGIDHARVKYSIKRKMSFNYYEILDKSKYFELISSYPSEMKIAAGSTLTDASGNFSIIFDALPDVSVPREYNPEFKFLIYAEVTDSNGETREKETSITIGYSNLKLSTNLSDTRDIDTSNGIFFIESKNLSDQWIPAKGTISVYLLKQPDRVIKQRLWDKPDQFNYGKNEFVTFFPYDEYENETSKTNWEKIKKVFTCPFATAVTKEFTIPGFNKWEPGEYIVEIESTDENGDKIHSTRYLNLFSSLSKQMPFKKLFWHGLSKGDVEPGENLLLTVGSTEKNICVIIDFVSHGDVVETRAITLDNEQKRIEFPIKEEYRGDLRVNMMCMVQNRSFYETMRINVPWNKDIDISFGTFRNKLIPGEKEEWQIKIKNRNGKPVDAEMAAALYDASLDDFVFHEWSFNIIKPSVISPSWSNPNLNALSISIDNSYSLNESFSYTQEYYKLELFGFDSERLFSEEERSNEQSFFKEKTRILVPSSPKPPSQPNKKTDDPNYDYDAQPADGACYSAANPSSDRTHLTREPDDKIHARSPLETQPKQIRKNFNETAFFYPQLYTSPEGEITISFTIPEALTRWKMLGFAHTKNLEYGLITNELVTQKDLMVIPNSPRFFREGDTLIFTSKIVNLSGNEISGIARLHLFDASTMNPIDELFQNNEIETEARVHS